MGAQEYNASAEVKPYVSADNTGPIYLMPEAPVLSTNDFIENLENKINVYPNPLTGNEITINFNFNSETTIEIQLYDITGRKLENLINTNYSTGQNTISKTLDIPAGLYLLTTNTTDSSGNTITSKVEKLVKL